MSDTTRQSREQQLADKAPRRVPLHEQKRDFLNVLNADPRTHYRIVNDRDDRIERFKLGGYKVSDKKMRLGEGSVENTNLSVGSGTVINAGGGNKAVLMEVPKEIWEEDQKNKQQEITRNERLMRRRPGEQRSDGLEGEVDISRK